jgi:starch phosphorylase
MKKQTFNTNRLYGFLPSGIEGVENLAELALDMRWSWNHAADNLWQRLDPNLWERTHNPWVMLQTIKRSELESKLADPVISEKIKSLMASKRLAAANPAWFQKNHPSSPHLYRVLQHGIYVERSLADLCWRPWQCGRRPVKICQ